MSLAHSSFSKQVPERFTCLLAVTSFVTRWNLCAANETQRDQLCSLMLSHTNFLFKSAYYSVHSCYYADAQPQCDIRHLYSSWKNSFKIVASC